MKKTYSEQLHDDLENLYDEIDYDYDAMIDKDVSKELVGLYKELEGEMTFNYDDGLDDVAKKIQKVSQKNTEEVFEDEEEPVKVKRAAVKEEAKSPSFFKKTPSKKPSSPKTKKLLLGIILTIAIGVFLVSALKLISIKKGYDDSNKTYEEVDKDFFKGDTDNIDELDWDFTELFAQNPDVIGYIYCPGLVSYPIVQGSDNSYYLKHLFTHEWNDSGSIFADCNLPNKIESRNCIIYGHNMKDGSMFSKLLNYSNGDGYDFYNDHKEFHIFTTDDHHYVYKVLSVYRANIRSNIYVPDLNDQQFGDLLNEIQANSIYNTEHGELTLDSKIMTLSTCLDNYTDDLREVVILVRDREIPKKGATPAPSSTTVDE